MQELRISVQMLMNLRSLPPIDKRDLLLELLETIKTYIEFDDEKYYTLCAIWIIGTYFYKRFTTYPYLFLNAVKRSGKTKLLTLFSLLCYNAIFSPNMSTSSLFRLVQNNGSSTLLDETEDMNDPEKKADMRSILLSGYKKGTYVYRTEKNEDGIHTPVPYDPYSPKAIANIKGIEDILEDRTLPIILKRGLNQEIMNREVPLTDPLWVELRDKLTRFYLQEWRTVDEAYAFITNSSVVSAVNASSVVILEGKKSLETRVFVGRDWELWKPLFSLGYMMCQNCNATHEITTLTPETTQTTLTNLYELAKKITDLKDSETQTDAGESVLLMGLLDLVDKETPNYYSVAAIKAASSRYNETLPDWFNHRWIGRAMKRLGFTEKRRVGNGMQYKLDSNSVLDMANRLGIHLPEKDPDLEEDLETEEELEDPDPYTILFDDYESKKLYCLIRDNPGQTRDAFINLAYKAGLSAQESGVSWRKIQRHLTHDGGLWRVK
jgi:hypothetical protein